MYIILGATGHVGSVVAQTLLDRGEAVTIVTHDEDKAGPWRAKGATAAVADVGDSGALRQIFRTGRRAFLLNPPAAPSTDTDVEERRTSAAIVEALVESGLEKIVAESTFGAQPGAHCGDLGVLYEFEEALREQQVPATIQRAAYYMSNWDAMLESAREQGILPTMYPADLKIPMVAPVDLGMTAAGLLLEPVDGPKIHYVEGPERYSSGDVAQAFADSLGHAVRTVVTPRGEWEHEYRKLGFSEPAAKSYAHMTAVSVDGSFDMPEYPVRGRVSLTDYIADLVDRHSKTDV